MGGFWEGAGKAIGGLMSGGAGGIMSVVEKGMDMITTDDERMERENEAHRDEMNYKSEMRGLDIRETEIYLKDADSARGNQSRIQESKNAGWLSKNIQSVLTLVLVALTFTMFSRVLFGGIDPDSGEHTISMMILGSLVTIITQVVGYYYGASRDNRKDTKALQEVINNKNK